MKKWLAVVLILSLHVVVGAVDQPDARFLSISLNYQLRPDGSWLFDCQQRVRLDTYAAVNRLGETFIVTNPDFQTLTVLKAETTMADGTKVAVPANALNEVLPFPAHLFADFSRMREMVVTHTGLERGAVIELHYQVLTRPGFMPYFTGREPLTRIFPIDRYTLRIEWPDQYRLQFKVFNLELTPKRQQSPGRSALEFSQTDVPPLLPEPGSRESDQPFVLFSSAIGWPEAFAFLDGDSALPQALKEKARQFKERQPQTADFLRGLQKMIADEIQTCPLDLNVTGLRLRGNERIFASAYATAVEKTRLLARLLAAMDVPTHILAVLENDPLGAVPSALAAGSFLIKVKDGNEFLYLDPFNAQAEFFPYKKEGAMTFNLDSRQIEPLPADDWDRNRVAVSGTVRLSAEKTTGNLTVTASGYFQNYPAARENQQAFLTGLLAKFFPVKELAVKKIEIIGPTSIRAEIEFSGGWLQPFGEKALGLHPVKWPQPPADALALEQRRLPLHIDAPYRLSLRLRLELPAEWAIDYIGRDVVVENGVGHFRRSWQPEAGEWRAELGIRSPAVAPDRYPELKNLLQPWLVPDYWLVLVRK